MGQLCAYMIQCWRINSLYIWEWN